MPIHTLVLLSIFIQILFNIYNTAMYTQKYFDQDTFDCKFGLETKHGKTQEGTQTFDPSTFHPNVRKRILVWVRVMVGVSFST